MPRPAKYGTAATESVRIRLTPEQRRDLEQVARENQMPLATVVREAVTTFVADYRDGASSFVVRNPRAGA